MQGSTRVPRVSDGLIDELVLANKILYDQKIVDGLGHISVRHDKDPSMYLMSRMRAPALVAAGDIIVYDLDSNPLGDNRKSYNERLHPRRDLQGAAGRRFDRPLPHAGRSFPSASPRRRSSRSIT